MIKVKRWVWGKISKEECGKGIWLEAKCCGVEYRFKTVCNREDCPVCGQEKSWAHFRRFIRGVGFIFEMLKWGSVGYMVVTCPEEKRYEWSSKEVLGGIARYLKRLLKRELLGLMGVMRWHFAGDKGKKWYPHLNILFVGGYIDGEVLKRIKELIERRLGVKVVNYHYARSVMKVLHWWRYISRPTFLLQNEIPYENIKGMKNVIWFGFEKIKRKYERMSGEEFLELAYRLFKEGYFEDVKVMARFIVAHSRCILCGEKLKWSKVKESEINNTNNDWKILGWGFYVRKEGLG